MHVFTLKLIFYNKRKIMNKEETITIPTDKYMELVNAQLELDLLKKGGVENWEWYDAAVNEYYTRLNNAS